MGAHPSRSARILLVVAGASIGMAALAAEREVSLLWRLEQAEVEGDPDRPPMLRAFDEDERIALQMEAPTRIRFPLVAIPSDGTLSVSLAIEGNEAQCVEVLARNEDRTVVLWSGSVEPGVAEPLDVNIDLSALAHRTIDLIVAAPGPGKARLLLYALNLAPFPVSSESAQAVTITRSLLPDVHPRGGTPRRPGEMAEIEVEIPPRGELEVSGVVIRDTRRDQPAGPVLFQIWIDGAQVLDRSETANTRTSFTTRIDLRPWANRTSQICMRILDEGKAPSGFRWTRAQVLSHRQVDRSAPPGPNLLVLLVDTLRADHLGAYGHPVPTSPHQDRFSRRARLFEQVIAQSSWTPPSVAALMSGSYQPPHQGLGIPRLSHQIDTYPEQLQKRGITTAAIVANPIIKFDEGYGQGFETFLPADRAPASAVNQLFHAWRRQYPYRWFAYLHYLDPHDPYRAPLPERGLYATGGALPDDLMRELARKRDREKLPIEPEVLTNLRAAYDEEILGWDRNFGYLLATLRSEPTTQETVVAVLGDHGEEFLEHGWMHHGRQLYTESVRVPLIVSDRPALSRHPLELRQALPWIMRRAVMGPGPEAPPTASVTASILWRGQDSGRGLSSLGTDDWKYVENPSKGTVELYRADRDPAETHNLAAVYPEVASRLSRLLAKILGELPTRGEPPSPLDPTTEQQLRELGYLP